MIRNSQKKRIHIYKAAAALSDSDYRSILVGSASVASAADPDMNQSGFERAMAAIETRLFQRVHAGEVPDPIGNSRWIFEEFYWRKKLPGRGVINSRQGHKIDELWNRLKEYLPEEKRTIAYLGGILYQSTGRRDVGYYALKNHEAAFLIDALKDRLAHAIKQPCYEEELIPF